MDTAIPKTRRRGYDKENEIKVIFRTPHLTYQFMNTIRHPDTRRPQSLDKAAILTPMPLGVEVSKRPDPMVALQRGQPSGLQTGNIGRQFVDRSLSFPRERKVLEVGEREDWVSCR